MRDGGGLLHFSADHPANHNKLKSDILYQAGYPNDTTFRA